MRRIATLLLALCAAVSYAQDHVRFIVTGDDRWDTGHPRAGEDENGVNVTVLARVMKAAMAEKPDVMLLSGDLVGGAKTDAEEQAQFDTWIKVMQPVYDSGIKVLTAIGNHEMHAPDADDVWRKAMSGNRSNPDNGPAKEKGLTYSYVFKNCLFISLDEFQEESPTINQTWLDGVLKAPHPPHVFAFAHKAAFYVGHHDDIMSTVPAARDTFIKSLVDAGARTVFFGHDHLYDHSSAKLADWPESKAIHQFVIGTSGAPLVKSKPLTDSDGDWKLTRTKHVDQKYGYAVVDVDGPKVTIVFKEEDSPGVFVAADTYTYTLPAAK